LYVKNLTYMSFGSQNFDFHAKQIGVGLAPERKKKLLRSSLRPFLVDQGHKRQYSATIARKTLTCIVPCVARKTRMLTLYFLLVSVHLLGKRATIPPSPPR